MGDDSPAAAMPTRAAVSGDESDHVRGDDGERQIGFAASSGLLDTAQQRIPRYRRLETGRFRNHPSVMLEGCPAVCRRCRPDGRRVVGNVVNANDVGPALGCQRGRRDRRHEPIIG